MCVCCLRACVSALLYSRRLSMQQQRVRHSILSWRRFRGMHREGLERGLISIRWQSIFGAADRLGDTFAGQMTCSLQNHRLLHSFLFSSLLILNAPIFVHTLNFQRGASQKCCLYFIYIHNKNFNGHIKLLLQFRRYEYNCK